MSINKRRVSKIISVFLVSCVLVATATASAFVSKNNSVSSGFVLYENEYKTIKLFSKTELEGITGVQLTSQNAEKMRSALTNADVWLDAGFKQTHAEYIANRFVESKQQAVGIIKKIAKNSKLGLKVIVVNQGSNPHLNIGVEYYDKGGNSTSEEGKSKDPVKQGGDTLSAIKKLEIEIEYSKKDVELEYNYSSLKKCVYENEFTGEKLKQNDAVKLTENILAGLDLQSASKKEIANQVIERLEVNSNYEKFSFEVKFLDGSKVEFELE